MFSKCRACLGSCDNMRYVSSIDIESKNFIAMLTSVAKFEWIDDDRIPSYLCGECETTLQISYHFQKQCQESNKIISKILENETKTFTDPLEIREKSPKVETTTINRVAVEAVDDYKNIENQNLICVECSFTVSSLKALTSHMSQAHKETRGKWCCICNKIFNNLREHRRVHNGMAETCPFCSKVVKKRCYIEHLRSHSESQQISCQLCHENFSSFSALKLHYKIHGPGQESEFNFATDGKLEEYSNVKEETKSQSFDVLRAVNFCKICNKNVRSLTNHVIQLHDGSYRDLEPIHFICHICNKSYKKKENLQVHVNVHLGKTRHKCSYCGKPARSRSDLRDHERTHTGEKPNNCNVCGKSFCQASALRTHMKQHTGRPEVCKICQKRFCRPSELKLHLRKHAGEKPFLCTQCGKAFCQKSHLTEHMKTHSKQRPFQCDRCDKAFKTKSLLTSHLQIHLGDKKFKCSVCSYACFKPYRLAQHMKQHNEDKLEKKEFVCRVCEKGFTTQGMLNAHMSASHNAIL